MAETRLLAKEQQKAIDVFKMHEHNIETLYPLSDLVNPEGALLPTNFVAASRKPINKADLPKEKTWTWNQSNSKATIQCTVDTTIILRKLNTRKRAGSNKSPSFKVWLYEVQHAEEEFYFVWCEKGINDYQYNTIIFHQGVSTPIGFIYPQHL